MYGGFLPDARGVSCGGRNNTGVLLIFEKTLETGSQGSPREWKKMKMT